MNDMTYGQLFRVLERLNFERAEVNDPNIGNGIVFREHKHKAFLLLPVVREKDRVRQEHFLSARNAVLRTGVANVRGFETALKAEMNHSEWS